jgi:hypothetical protein
MGLIGLGISSSRYDNKRGAAPIPVQVTVQHEYPRKKKLRRGNPNPANFEIVKFGQINDNLVVQIRYPNCKNYEGNKILVYNNLTMPELLKQKTIDPHFSNNKKFHSPFARFEPTKAGWKQACKLAVFRLDS